MCGTKNEKNWLNRSFLAIKENLDNILTAIAITVALVLFLLDLFDKTTSSQAINGIIVSTLIIFAIKLITDRRDLTTITNRLDSAKRDIVASLEWYTDAFDKPKLFQVISQITKHYLELSKTGDAFFTELAQEQFEECNDTINNLRNGEFKIISQKAHTYLIRLMGTTQKSVFATSLVNSGRFWLSGGGKEYLQKNVEVATREENAVTITRVFILDDPNNIDDETRQAIEQHMKAEVLTTMVAFRTNLPDFAIRDMAIFDDYYVEELFLIPGSTEMGGTQIFNNEAKRKEAFRVRENILREAKDAKELFEIS